MHAVPLTAFNGGKNFDISRKYDRDFLSLSPMVGSQLSHRHNLDGIAVYSVPLPSRSYLQLYRHGIIESVMTWPQSSVDRPLTISRSIDR